VKSAISPLLLAASEPILTYGLIAVAVRLFQPDKKMPRDTSAFPVCNSTPFKKLDPFLVLLQ
jgi:hypothetical protein